MKKQPAGTGMVPSHTELGSFIRARRLNLGLRQVQLAKQCGISQKEISAIEIGRRKHPCDNSLNKLAKVLECDFEQLWGLTPVKPCAQPTTELGRLIRSRREELGMSIKIFAKKMGITCVWARHLEIRSSSISYKTLDGLVEVLDFDRTVLTKFIETTRKESKELGMTLEKLGKELNVSRQFVNQIESGRAPLRSNEMIIKLTEVLGLDLNKLETTRPKKRLKMKNNSNSLGGFISSKRLELYLTQRQLGECAEVSAALICMLENDKFRATPKVIHKLQKVLGQIPAELIRAS